MFLKSWFATRTLAAVLLVEIPAFAQSLQQAQELQARGDWKSAEETWRKLIEQAPQDYRLWTSLGVTLSHQARYADAVAAYQKALVIRPKDPQTELNLGIAYFKSGKLPRAIEPLRVSATALGDSPQIDTLLGMSLFGTGKYVDAAHYLQRASQADPGNLNLEQVLAQSYLYGKQYQKAQSEFERMLVRDPDSANVHMLLGEAYDADGQLEPAIKEFQDAAQKGNLPNLHFGLGYLLWKNHKYDRAEAEFRKELNTDSQNYQALAYLGDTLMKRGDSEEAGKLFRESIKIHDTIWLTHFHLGVMAQEQKRYGEAAAELRRAITLDSSRPEPHYRLAQVLKATGQSEAARLELEKVAKLHEQKDEDLIHKITGRSSPPQ
jgi:tetratricopeptide (TPR) repeat protein